MTHSKLNRRRFLATLGVGGAAAAVAVASQQGGERKPKQAEAGKQGQGYQLTEHVRRYYETAKV